MPNRGFTLIELVVVLSILTISLCLVQTSFVSNAKRTLNAACMELQADLRFAQRSAVYENRYYSVTFDVSRNRYYIHSTGNGLGSTTVKEKVFSDDIKLLSINSGENTVSYTPRGTVDGACTINLRNSHYKVDLTVNLGSGRVEQKSFVKLTM